MTTDNANLSAARLRTKMAEVLGVDMERLEDAAVLTDLVTSSFLLVEMIIEMQEDFGTRFNQEDMQGVTTVGDLIGLFLKTVDARE